MNGKIIRPTIFLVIIFIIGIGYRAFAQSANKVKSANEMVLSNEDFEFFISQNGFSYSSKDSLYADKRNLRPQDYSENLVFDGIIQPDIGKEYIHAKVGLSENEKRRISSILTRCNFHSLPSDLCIRNIWFMRDYYGQEISIKNSHSHHRVIWDGIYPDIGDNKYIIQHRHFVTLFNQIGDTIRSILSKKSEIARVYNSNPSKNPISIERITLKGIGFPIEQSKNIGKYHWSVVCSD